MSNEFYLFQVKELDLSGCKTGGEIEGLTEEFESLEFLDINNCNITNIKSFPTLPNLRKLRHIDPNWSLTVNLSSARYQWKSVVKRSGKPKKMHKFETSHHQQQQDSGARGLGTFGKLFQAGRLRV